MTDPPLPGGTLDDRPVIPDAYAGWFSLITFSWITPILNLGYARPLETTDLWKMDETRMSHVYADRILASFDRRQKAADAYNTRLANGEIGPGMKGLWWSLRGTRAEREKQWREKEVR